MIVWIKCWSRKISLAAVLLIAPGFQLSAHAIIRAEQYSPLFPNDSVIPLYLANRLCSATLIGPNVILTAAHCAAYVDWDSDVNNYSSRGLIYVSINGKKIGVILSHDPDYNDANREADPNDFAIGILEEAVPDSEVKPISLDLSPLSKGDDVVIAGYGMSGSKRGEGPPGFLHFGKATIDSIKNGLMILSDKKQAVSDEGDSGGPVLTFKSNAWFLSGVIVAGNERTFFSKTINEYSYLPQLSNPSFKTFLDQAITKYGLKICGINKNC
jgi:hypothetical protein